MTDDNILEQFVATLNQLETEKHILDLVFSLYLALVSHVSCHNAVLFSFNIKGIITNNQRDYSYLSVSKSWSRLCFQLYEKLS